MEVVHLVAVAADMEVAQEDGATRLSGRLVLQSVQCTFPVNLSFSGMLGLYCAHVV